MAKKDLEKLRKQYGLSKKEMDALIKRIDMAYKKVKKDKRWIQKAKIKKGALHRQLSIPADKDIPITLLKRIKNATTGGTITNPTKTGKRRIKITTLLKRRVNFALNVR